MRQACTYCTSLYKPPPTPPFCFVGPCRMRTRRSPLYGWLAGALRSHHDISLHMLQSYALSLNCCMAQLHNRSCFQALAARPPAASRVSLPFRQLGDLNCGLAAISSVQSASAWSLVSNNGRSAPPRRLQRGRRYLSCRPPAPWSCTSSATRRSRTWRLKAPARLRASSFVQATWRAPCARVRASQTTRGSPRRR